VTHAVPSVIFFDGVLLMTIQSTLPPQVTERGGEQTKAAPINAPAKLKQDYQSWSLSYGVS